MFRVNFPVTQGNYSADVGVRTTHMFVNQVWGALQRGRPDVDHFENHQDTVFVLEVNLADAFEVDSHCTTIVVAVTQICTRACVCVCVQSFIELASRNDKRRNKFYVLSAWMGSTFYEFLNQLSLKHGCVCVCVCACIVRFAV